jgi:hypothetical protein
VDWRIPGKLKKRVSYARFLVTIRSINDSVKGNLFSFRYLAGQTFNAQVVCSSRTMSLICIDCSFDSVLCATTYVPAGIDVAGSRPRHIVRDSKHGNVTDDKVGILQGPYRRGRPVWDLNPVAAVKVRSSAFVLVGTSEDKLAATCSQ